MVGAYSGHPDPLARGEGAPVLKNFTPLWALPLTGQARSAYTTSTTLCPVACWPYFLKPRFELVILQVKMKL